MKSIAYFSMLVFVSFILFSCGGKESKTNDTTDTKTTEKQTKSSKSKHFYDIEKGMIEYKMETIGIPTIMTMYWDDFGKKTYTESVMEVMGIKTSSYVLNDGKYIYSWDGTTKQGTKLKFKKSQNVNYNDITKEVMDKYQMIKEAGEEINGKFCDVYSMDFQGAKTKTWIWKGIAIKTVSQAMGMTVTTEMTKMQ